MSTWNQLLRYLNEARRLQESKEYRAGLKGSEPVRLKDLEDLASPKGANTPLEPMGGLLVFKGGYKFEPKIWKGWRKDLGSVLVLAATDKTGQHVGAPQGSMAFKQNWGGRVVFTPGKPNSADFESKPSAMDLYDVVMEAEIEEVVGKKGPMQVGNLLRLAYSPAIGSFDERKSNLVSLLNGGSTKVKRRPQPEVPGPTPDEEKNWAKSPSVPVVNIKKGYS